MKSTINVLGIISLVVIIGFSFSACDGLLSKDDNTPVITISGTPKVGETLTAKSVGEFTSGSTFFWHVSDSPNPDISNWMLWMPGRESGTDGEYLLLMEYEVGRYIRAVRSTPKYYEGISSIYSNIIGPILPKD